LNTTVDSEIEILVNGGTVFALGGNDKVIGSSGKDFIDGGAGDDLIEGGGGADLLLGGAGDDTFLVRRPGDYPLLEIVDGGIGFDKLLFEGSGTFTVNSLTKAVELFKLGNADGTTSTVDSNLVGTLLTYGAQFEGNDGSNVILGSLQNDVIRGGDGAFDLLAGLAGDDEIHGGNGVDIIFGDAPKPSDLQKLPAALDSLGLAELVDLEGVVSLSDDLAGLSDFLGSDILLPILDEALSFLIGSGDDVINGGDGLDLLFGGGGNDTINGGGGSDVLIGGAGDDQLDGGTGLLDVDVAFYGLAGSGIIVDLGLGKATVDGDGGTDTLRNIESVIGSSFDDQISGDEGLNILLGGDGDDTINGRAGGDLLIGGAGADRFIQGAGDSAGGTGTTFTGNNFGFVPLTIDRIIDFNAAEGDVLVGNADLTDPAIRTTRAAGTYLFRGNIDPTGALFSISNTGDDLLYTTVTATALPLGATKFNAGTNSIVLENGFAGFNVADNFALA